MKCLGTGSAQPEVTTTKALPAVGALTLAAVTHTSIASLMNSLCVVLALHSDYLRRVSQNYRVSIISRDSQHNTETKYPGVLLTL